MPVAGGVQLSFRWPPLPSPSTAEAVRLVGVPGGATGVAVTGSDSAPSPWALAASTVTE